MANKNPVVLIHGYSDSEQGFQTWERVLKERGYDSIYVCNYKTLTNEVTIRDIAEGFDRALRYQGDIRPDQDFDAIVHSTGMLVIRSWMAVYAKRRSRLKRLIALAPATFGSPLAHKGRSFLGAIFKGNRILGPDFLESGTRVLDALELGSPFTWDLAHIDILEEPDHPSFYGSDSDTPYVFTLCGTQQFSFPQSLANSPGSDGTVRLAGCALNTCKFSIDLTIDPGNEKNANNRLKISPWSNLEIPVIPIPQVNHGTILSQPQNSPILIDLVDQSLQVSDQQAFETWLRNAKAYINNTEEVWQQFIIHVVDERGESVPDYYIDFCRKTTQETIKMDVHRYSQDPSFRCFHVEISKLPWASLTDLQLKIVASSGSELIEYFGYGCERIDSPADDSSTESQWDAILDLEADLVQLQENNGVHFFYPWTTTLIEIKLNREPVPIKRMSQLFTLRPAAD